MVSTDVVAVPLDSNAVEARTQVVGRELITAARQAHDHFSVLNRWTEQVLRWCMSDVLLKSAVLRFIDVLPSLRSAREVSRHVREYFPGAATRLPPALRIGTSLARGGLITAPAVAAVVRQLVEHAAAQFIAESHPERIRHVINELAERGASCTLDVLGEQVLSEAEADAYAAQYTALLHEVAAAYSARSGAGDLITCGPLVNISVKPTALSPRFDPICAVPSVDSVAARLLPLMARADEHRALINLDMEQYEVRDLTLEVAKHVLTHARLKREPALGVVVQAYLRDAETMVEGLVDWLVAHDRHLTVRLVKGAYWDYEVSQAKAHNWPVPVYEDKAATDAQFERLTERLMRAQAHVRVAIASHNIRSIAHAMAVAEALSVEPRAIEFQLLYGMGEAIHSAVAARGYPVRIYTPIGALIPGMGYLVRRLLENTANDSFLRHDFLNEGSTDELLTPPRPRTTRHRSASPAATAWQNEPLLDFSMAENRERVVGALSTVRAQLGARHPLLLGDGAVESDSTRTVRNPAALDEVLGYVSHATPAHVRHAVQLGVDAQAQWGRTAPAERIAALRRAAALMREQRFTLAAWEMLEVGKTWREADADVVEAVDYLEYYAAQMDRLVAQRPVAQMPGERNTYSYAARGLAVVIAPWNFPLAIPTGMVSAALVTGNAVIFKAAEQSPIVGLQLVHLLRQAGVPPAVLQCVPGDGETIGAALVAHAHVAQILFTGSRAVGLDIIGRAAQVEAGQRHVKHVVTEMGGKNALIVDADADLDAAVGGILASAFGYGGQKCSAASRLILHEAIAARVLTRLEAATDRLRVGDPTDPSVDIGPLIDAAAQQRLAWAIAQAAEVGTLVYRYPQSRLPWGGHFVGPTIVSDVPHDHPLAREELFGPFLCVFRVKTFADGLALANDSDYALTGGVYTRSPAHVAQAMDRFDVGNLYINRKITGAIVGRQPFGGHRLSGLGTKAGGPDYLLQLVVPKTICEDTRRHGMPLE
jgi:RHH-type proline utilization regulon transcriptional repressor/proline dehydrogenase/delta 1-pyrroline-5-carboxylate dehydrogenase